MKQKRKSNNKPTTYKNFIYVTGDISNQQGNMSCSIIGIVTIG